MSEQAGPSIGDSLREYARGIAGGLMFSLPLLYTMEVWWTGFIERQRVCRSRSSCAWTAAK
ncbi:MAG TPA: DUF2391 family protein, partial [Chthoniobacterales bacterium]|nr:DUF2391 family protein [Chthoniobacterales bacterium]